MILNTFVFVFVMSLNGVVSAPQDARLLVVHRGGMLLLRDCRPTYGRLSGYLRVANVERGAASVACVERVVVGAKAFAFAWPRGNVVVHPELD